MRQRKFKSRTAFTLIELLVVISVITLLLSILMPVLWSSRAQGKRIVCGSNIRQLVLANESYASHFDGYYVRAGLDVYSDDSKHRWYGIRDSKNSPFDITRGPLMPHLADVFLSCPQKVNFQPQSPTAAGYDAGNGGYGYNIVYIGSTIWKDGYEDPACKNTAKRCQIKNPAETVMFSDTAAAKDNNYFEHSFAWPRYFVVNTQPVETWEPDPSIHFRHYKKANIAWSDAHVTAEKIARYDGFNEDVRSAVRMGVGWFEPMNNSLFDLE